MSVDRVDRNIIGYTEMIWVHGKSGVIGLVVAIMHPQCNASGASLQLVYCRQTKLECS